MEENYPQKPSRTALILISAVGILSIVLISLHLYNIRQQRTITLVEYPDEDPYEEFEDVPGIVFDEGAVPMTISAYTKRAEVAGTSEEAYGMVQVSYTDGIYSVEGQYANLPSLLSGEYYEGILIDNETGQRMSTGRLLQWNNSWMTLFSTTEDLNVYEGFIVVRNQEVTGESKETLTGSFAVVEGQSKMVVQ